MNSWDAYNVSPEDSDQFNFEDNFDIDGNTSGHFPTIEGLETLGLQDEATVCQSSAHETTMKSLDIELSTCSAR